jgi:hypothetical protein
MKKVVIKNLDLFMRRVWGADCFVRNFPELQTTGVYINTVMFDGRQHNYIVDPSTGLPIHHTSFFSGKEMRYLKVIEEQNG